jgi:hypothetical protein
VPRAMDSVCCRSAAAASACTPASAGTRSSPYLRGSRCREQEPYGEGRRERRAREVVTEVDGALGDGVGELAG